MAAPANATAYDINYQHCDRMQRFAPVQTISKAGLSKAGLLPQISTLLDVRCGLLHRLAAMHPLQFQKD